MRTFTMLMKRFGLQRRSRLAILCVTCLGIAAVSAPAQAPQSDQANPAGTISVTSRLVVLDVVVLDHNGKPVTNLDRSQFTITEDKAPQTIRNFDPPSAHAMPSGGTADLVHSVADLPKIGQAPVNVLVFDEVDTPFHQLAYARQMMEKYLKAQPPVLPVPTLFIAAGYSRVVVLHDYTQSRADLLESVEKHTADLDFTQIVNTLNGGAGGSENGLVKTLGAMLQIAQSVAGIPGRKNVIWVGTGYNKAYDLNNMSEKDHDKVVAAIKQVTDRMLQERVTLYIIDPGGPLKADDPTDDTIDPSNVSSSGSAIGDFGDNMGMDTFADNTGGRVIGGRNDLDAQVAEVSTEGTEYYTLSYAPSGDSDAAQPFRKIHVTVNVPGLRVITREGYFATPQAPVAQVALAPKAKQANDVKYDLMSAARTTMPYTGLHTDAKRSKKGYTVMVNANDLKFTEQPGGSRLAEVTILAVCYNAKGKETAQHAAEMKEELAASDVIKPDSRVSFAFPMTVPPFTDRVRFVVRDAATGVIGAANANP
ncbi:MAG TPA: VWA domain-containing protein [Acidobacteriaceae bacterium]|nr:VWA domain-containing protein [Acidobacteriaceae bacterium]